MVADEKLVMDIAGVWKRGIKKKRNGSWKAFADDGVLCSWTELGWMIR